MISHAEYLVRPAHQFGESLAGYVYRFHAANGHQVPISVRKLVIALYDPITLYKSQSHGGRKETFDLLQHLLGTACVLDAAWWIDGDYQSGRAGLNAEILKLCPACVGTFGFHMAVWELPLVVACPIHGVRLMSQCPHCQRDLRWSRLLPDWACQCGQSIPAMAAPKASAVQVQRSALLIGTVDVQLADAYPQQALLMPGLPRQRLDGAYRHLYRAFLLRRAIITALNQRRPKALESIPSHPARTEPHRWEIMLLQSWPRSFKEELLRLARRYWRATMSTFVLAPRDSIVDDVVTHLGVSRAEEWVNDPMRRAAQELIDSFKAPLTTQTLVFFNPRYSVKERDDRLLCFWNWWRLLRRILSRRRSNVPVLRPLGHPTREDVREAMSVTLVSRLIDAANAGTDPRRYVALFDTWRYGGEGFHPVTLVQGWANALTALPYARLAELALKLDAIECGPP